MPTHSLRLSAFAALAVLAASVAPASASVRFAARPTAVLPVQHGAADQLSPDAKLARLLYVGDNANNQVSVFSLAGNHPSPKPIAVITSGLVGPQGLTTDRFGSLYVTNLYANTVTEYAPGATTPKATLSNGLNTPTDVKVDGFGNVYVSNSPGFGAQSYILEYPVGSQNPSAIWYTPSGNQIISGFALLNPTTQGATSIYVAAYIINPSTLLASGTVLSCYPGNTTCVTLGNTFGQTGGLAVEQSPGGPKPFEYMVVDQYVPGVDTIQQGGQSTLVTGGTPEFIALNAARKSLFVADRFYGRVTQYSLASGKAINQFYPAGGGHTTQVYGVAVTPAGTYF